MRAAGDIGEVVIASFEKRAFNSRLAVKYTRLNDVSCSTCGVHVFLYHLPLGCTLPHLRSSLSTLLSPPELSLSLTPGTQAEFSGTTRTGASQQQSPASFGQISQLTPHADAAFASHAHSLSQSQPEPHSQSSVTPAASAGSAPFFADISACALD